MVILASCEVSQRLLSWQDSDKECGKDEGDIVFGELSFKLLSHSEEFVAKYQMNI